MKGLTSFEISNKGISLSCTIGIFCILKSNGDWKTFEKGRETKKKRMSKSRWEMQHAIFLVHKPNDEKTVVFFYIFYQQKTIDNFLYFKIICNANSLSYMTHVLY